VSDAHLDFLTFPLYSIDTINPTATHIFSFSLFLRPSAFFPTCPHLSHLLKFTHRDIKFNLLTVSKNIAFSITPSVTRTLIYLSNTRIYHVKKLISSRFFLDKLTAQQLRQFTTKLLGLFYLLYLQTDKYLGNTAPAVNSQTLSYI